MSKIVAAVVTTLFLTASPLAYAQVPAAGVVERLSAGDVSALTDARVNLVKAALQLTPDQEKYWPAVEGAIRARAKDRQARIQNAEARFGELRDRVLSRFCAIVILLSSCIDAPMSWLNEQPT